MNQTLDPADTGASPGAPRKKLAVGLYHFNVQYVAGAADMYHRYCTEAIAPFLEAVDRRKLRTSFEIAANGLEFLAEHYPALLDLLRRLTAAGQIELISATYTPSIWPAFPARDLIKSVQLSRDVLRRLGLPATRIFFAHEAFFGPGICGLTEYFDVAVCKDDYLRYCCHPEDVFPAYRAGQLLVLAGSNHIVNELYRRLPRLNGGRLLPAHRNRLLEAAPVADRPSSPRSRCGNVDWFWYHLGSGHNYSTWRRPEDGDDFFFDRDWAGLVDDLLDSYLSDGYSFATVGDLAASIRSGVTRELPPLVEGSWDAEGSEAVFAWMGRHQNVWEDDPGILGLSWRSRKRLVDFERSLKVHGPAGGDDSLSHLWKQQLLAESSDSLGWAPRPKEVDFVKEAARRVLADVNAHTSDAVCQMAAAEHQAATVYCKNAPADPPFILPELFGADGDVTVMCVGSNLQVAETWFRPTTTSFGVRFKAFPRSLVYCPSGKENDPACIPWDSMRPDILFLPLANGLIALGDDLFLIRDNSFGQAAICVNKTERHISMMVRGMTRAKDYRWRFFLVRGALQEAVACANTINCV